MRGGRGGQRRKTGKSEKDFFRIVVVLVYGK